MSTQIELLTEIRDAVRIQAKMLNIQRKNQQEQIDLQLGMSGLALGISTMALGITTISLGNNPSNPTITLAGVLALVGGCVITVFGAIPLAKGNVGIIQRRCAGVISNLVEKENKMQRIGQKIDEWPD